MYDLVVTSDVIIIMYYNYIIYYEVSSYGRVLDTIKEAIIIILEKVHLLILVPPQKHLARLLGSMIFSMQ